MSCVRDNTSHTRDIMSCVRDNMSCVKDIMSSARHNPLSKKKLCPNYTTVHLEIVFFEKNQLINWNKYRYIAYFL